MSVAGGEDPRPSAPGDVVSPAASSVLSGGDYDSLGGGGGGIKTYRWLLSCDARFPPGQQQGGCLKTSGHTVAGGGVQ